MLLAAGGGHSNHALNRIEPVAVPANCNSVLGVGAPPEVEVPTGINALLEARQAARKAKDFKRGDAIRDELKAKGWLIEDTPKGARVKRL